jgi:hypothetical protein
MTTEEVTSTLSVGDYVIHSRHKNWGEAIIRDISLCGTIGILFINKEAAPYNTLHYNANPEYLSKVGSHHDILILLL